MQAFIGWAVKKRPFSFHFELHFLFLKLIVDSCRRGKTCKTKNNLPVLVDALNPLSKLVFSSVTMTTFNVFPVDRISFGT